MNRVRVLIACAVVLERVVVFADEPSTELDVTRLAVLLALFRELEQRGGTGVLLISHDLGVVSDIDVLVVVIPRRQQKKRLHFVCRDGGKEKPTSHRE